VESVRPFVFKAWRKIAKARTVFALGKAMAEWFVGWTTHPCDRSSQIRQIGEVAQERRNAYMAHPPEERVAPEAKILTCYIQARADQAPYIELQHYLPGRPRFSRLQMRPYRQLSAETAMTLKKAAGAWMEFKYPDLRKRVWRLTLLPVSEGPGLISRRRDFGTPSVRGVPLLPVALMLSDDELGPAKQTKKQWLSKKAPRLPSPVGKALGQSQKNLYRPSALADFLINTGQIPSRDKPKLLKSLQKRLVPGRAISPSA
jgi:hypothetical protein